MGGHLRAAGAGDGRCQCAAEWAGPFCSRKRHTELSLLEPELWVNRSLCAVEPSTTAFQLEDQIFRICQGLRLRHAATARMCKAIFWRAHWETGGQYSTCSAFPRASLLLPAVMQDTGLCCSTGTGCTVADLVEAGNYNFSTSEVSNAHSCAFLEADYGDLTQGTCAWAVLEGFVGSPMLAGYFLAQEWYSARAQANTESRNVISASECQDICAQVQSLGSPVVSFFRHKSCSLIVVLDSLLLLKTPTKNGWPFLFPLVNDQLALGTAASLLGRPATCLAF